MLHRGRLTVAAAAVDTAEVAADIPEGEAAVSIWEAVGIPEAEAVVSTWEAADMLQVVVSIWEAADIRVAAVSM